MRVAVYGISLLSPRIVSIRRGHLCQGWASVCNIQVWVSRELEFMGSHTTCRRVSYWLSSFIYLVMIVNGLNKSLLAMHIYGHWWSGDLLVRWKRKGGEP